MKKLFCSNIVPFRFLNLHTKLQFNSDLSLNVQDIKTVSKTFKHNITLTVLNEYSDDSSIVRVSTNFLMRPTVLLIFLYFMTDLGVNFSINLSA